MAGTVPKHVHKWYPVSRVLEPWAPQFKSKGFPGPPRPRGWPGTLEPGSVALWACGAERRCIVTLTAVDMFRLDRKEPQPRMGLPNWYPMDQRVPEGMAPGPGNACPACGKAFGTREAAVNHIAARHA